MIDLLFSHYAEAEKDVTLLIALGLSAYTYREKISRGESGKGAQEVCKIKAAKFKGNVSNIL